MKIKNKCPKCKSDKIKLINYLDVKCIICSECGFDESKEYDVYPQEKKSQKAKGKYTKYKIGGFGRAKK